ncbi:hypothetical protein [Bradyrhizobium erythrophlei]|jgi:hypothetical protein|uniref:Methyl-accepting chemotaxis protein n=1 Tax=Bradyrhizobium erythrophlei TaxID=1437360 RepID=A0A1M7UP85_9BRAD|nr:hypothetical protein [Bradyrhizobium erythrophlei]SHN84768.1 hypothetical protein SAMN05444170_6057 [Bradyrhizobium erythrophlei]
MSQRSARILIAVISLLVLLTVAASLSIDLGKYQQRLSTQEGQAALQGIGNPSQLESALKQHPSNSLLKLMAQTLRITNDTKAAIDQLAAQIEPARVSKEPNFGSVTRDELDAFRRDLKTAEANARAFLPRYAAIFKAERAQIDSATVSLHVPKEIASQVLDGVTQRQAKALNAISLILAARADYYSAYDKYIAFLSSELGSFKVVAGQFIFPLQRTVERYGAAAQAMTSSAKRVAELEADMKKQEKPLPEEWMQLTGVK